MAAGAALERDSSHSLSLSPCNSKSPIFQPPPATPDSLIHSLHPTRSGKITARGQTRAFRQSDLNGQLISAASIIDFERRAKITSFNPKMATDTWPLCSMERHEKRAIINGSVPWPRFRYTVSFNGRLVQPHFAPSLPEFIYYCTGKLI